jgi:hypothetical protein
MSPKSFLLALGIFCGGYVSNTLFDEVVDAAEKYFHLKDSAYKPTPTATSFAAQRSQK